MTGLTEYLAFFRQARKSFHTTGAIIPSGRSLARAIASQIQHKDCPQRLLEVGAGTGALTRAIVEHIGPEDQFDVVELNDQFVHVLEHRFAHDMPFRRVADRTRILHMPVQQLNPKRPYDFIVSGLPLNNFPAALVRELFGVFLRLLTPGGVLSFFEYCWIRQFKSVLAPRPERRRLSRVEKVIQRYLSRYEFRRDTVWMNLPPALVHHLRLADSRKPVFPNKPGFCRAVSLSAASGEPRRAAGFWRPNAPKSDCVDTIAGSS